MAHLQKGGVCLRRQARQAGPVEGGDEMGISSQHRQAGRLVGACLWVGDAPDVSRGPNNVERV